MNADDIVDIASLRRLVDEYALAVDGRDATGFADLFEDDGVLAVYEAGEDVPSIEYAGRVRLEEVVQLIAAFDATMHVMANHVVDIDGDEATGRVYALCHHLQEQDGKGEDTLMLLHYRDRYVRRDGRWRIARRDVLRQWTARLAAERARLTA
ncbi:MAG: nuclear transport factor 2 family protein [Solirubrobacteraceae bacterium]